MSPRGHDVHPAAEKGFECYLHPGQVHQRSSGLELYEEIYIAFPIGLPTGRGPKDPHLTRAVRDIVVHLLGIRMNRSS